MCRVFDVQSGMNQGGGHFSLMARGGDLPPSLPIYVVRIWSEMGPFSLQNGARGVHPYG